MSDNSATAAVRIRRRKVEDSISNLPDVILQHILSFIPTELAITTSLLSKRWRHVWSGIPSISFDSHSLEAASINKTLTLYTAPKILKFHLGTGMKHNVPHIDKWIEFAMSRNVENLSLKFWVNKYTIPDFFYFSSSLKQLSLQMHGFDMAPRCSVSWTSLKKLSLRGCILSDESIAKIISGCPVLESLTLYFRFEMKVLDLSKSLRLRILEIDRNVCWVLGPMQIVAPHIHCLILNTSCLPCILVDVSSLTEAKLNICCSSLETTEEADLLQVMVLEVLQKVHNVEKLTLGGNFLEILSLAEIRRLPFPMLKVKALNLETSISRYVIPGIERVLQNSPHLKKLTVHTWHCNAIVVEYLDIYLELQGLIPDNCWRSKDGVLWNKSHWKVKSKHVSSFMEVMLNNTKTLETMVVQLEEHYCKFKALVLTLSHNNNVSIVVSTNEW